MNVDRRPRHIIGTSYRIWWWYKVCHLLWGCFPILNSICSSSFSIMKKMSMMPKPKYINVSADHVPNGSWFTCNAGSVFIFAFEAAWAAWEFIAIVLFVGCPSRLPSLSTGGGWNLYRSQYMFIPEYFFDFQKCTQDTQLLDGLGLCPSCIQSSPRGCVRVP